MLQRILLIVHILHSDLSTTLCMIEGVTRDHNKKAQDDLYLDKNDTHQQPLYTRSLKRVGAEILC